MSASTEWAITRDGPTAPAQPHGQTWADYAATTGLPVFPVAILWDAAKGKWTKRPLTRNGHLNASTDVSRFDWSRANGFGIAMGNGLYSLDLDGYKDGCLAEQWLIQWQVPTATRTHRTVSGGLHLLYTLPVKHRDLRTRQNVVQGLDTRGVGGWIAFGAGYAVADSSPLAELPEMACDELLAGSGPSRDLTLPPLAAIDRADVTRRLGLALTFGRPSLRYRWAGGADGLHDTSASGFDMSIAKLLSNERFKYSEIVWLLATQFQHGVVARDGWTEITERQAMRAAARAVKGRGDGVMCPKVREMFYGR
ncbi:hypothetical protein SuNHUV7_22320 (plasmid) [Pseudoseohaeicola sp. NH-UV-7]|uniref:bifunctional DNA primase/polymerase n=1 Tax=Sulfitobacter sp. TBRI5 TaxID=2989732 RepID=UPI003A6A9159